MQYQYVGAWIKGFYRVASYAITADMIDEKVEAKLKVLAFWDKHGLDAALDYSHKSRRTLYRWKKTVQRIWYARVESSINSPAHST